jgi:small-conductance mechanosensitive channel/regulator of replication initiation timing
MKFAMKVHQWVVTLCLLALVIAAGVGLVLTRQSAQMDNESTRRRRPPIVDEAPLKAARTVAALATDRDEQRFSQQALKLADHEVDLAFSAAMRDASEHPDTPTPEVKALFDRVSKAQATVSSTQQTIDRLQKQIAATKEDRRTPLQLQLDLAKAQLELDQDELEDAQGDLMRSGADRLGRIQRQFKRHEAAQHEFEASHPQNSGNISEASSIGDDLVAQFSAWNGLRGKAAKLQRAMDEARESKDTLMQAHEDLEGVVGTEQENKGAITQDAASQIVSGKADNSGAATASAITSLHRISVDQKSLSDLDKRVQDNEDLANTYAGWIDLVHLRQRAATHSMLQSGLLIAIILLAIYLTGRLVDHFFKGLSADRTRLHTLRVVIRFALQAVGVLLILLVIVGLPRQMPTILGLAGAGLTVALKDFIVAFVGWFILMGRNGLRIGDWVEINGVVGEVVEINLWHTVLLETGNWADTGHPTGRKVAFMNSFAIEGHYFNFSTSGQWLWDEIEILVPASENPYQIVDAIQKVVTRETEANAQSAEQEWQKAMSHYRVRSVSAAPAISLRPTSAGVEVHVRYITRASERYAARTRLYQEIVELLHERPADSRAKDRTAATASLKR